MVKFKLSGLMFEMDNLSTWASNYSNLDFLRQWELGKFNQFLYYNKTKMEQIKMIWDNVYVWAKKVWTYKGWDFVTTRDPSKHTFVKLNAYWFNVDVLEQIKKYKPTATIKVKQKWTKIQLIAKIIEVLENWVFLVFNWEKQVFYKKDKFSIAI